MKTTIIISVLVTFVVTVLLMSITAKLFKWIVGIGILAIAGYVIYRYIRKKLNQRKVRELA